MAYDRTSVVTLRDEAPTITSSARIPRQLTARWFRQLADMLRAGVPLPQTLASMTQTESNRRWQSVQQEILNDLHSGLGFSDCLLRHPRAFDELSVRLIQTGEHTGQLDTTLLQIADLLEQQLTLKRQVRHALAYPICVAVVALTIAVFMLVYVVPQFATLFESQQAQLPWLTATLIEASDTVRNRPLQFMALLGAMGLIVRYAPRQRLLIRAPVIGTLWRQSAIARWSATMAMTLRAGVPFLEGLDLACANAQHPQFQKLRQTWTIAIEDGQPMHIAFAKGELFAPWTLQMMAIGQESGQLDRLLERVADFHEEAVTQTTSKLTVLLEPAVMIVIGGLVGTMLLAMYLPVFQMSNAIG